MIYIALSKSNDVYLSQSIKDIISFQPLSGNQFVCRDLEGSLKLHNTEDFKLLHDRDSEDSVIEYGDKILVSRRKEGDNSLSYELIEFDRQTAIFKPLLEDVFPLFNYGSKLLLKQYGESKSSLIQFDLEKQAYEWELDFNLRPFCYVGGIVFGSIGRKRNSVVAVSSIDGLTIWKYGLNDLGLWIDYDGQENKHQILRSLCVYESTLYLLLNSGKLLLLDIATGEKIALLENDKNTDQGSFSGMFMNAIELDVESSKLIQLFNQRYTEVDLESNVVTQEHLDDLKEHGVENMSRFVFDSDHIFFMDKNNQTIGALNRSTHKIDWTYKLSQAGVDESEQPRYGRDLKLKEDRLYVLDNKNTLHIFEKETYPA